MLKKACKEPNFDVTLQCKRSWIGAAISVFQLQKGKVGVSLFCRLPIK